MAILTVAQIRIGLASLPQELYDEIYHHVVDCDVAPNTNTKTTLRCMNIHDKPPVQLFLSRQIRNDFAEVYYGRSTFFFSAMADMKLWERSMSAESHLKLKDVRCALGPAYDDPIVSYLVIGHLTRHKKPNYSYGKSSEELLKDFLSFDILQHLVFKMFVLLHIRWSSASSDRRLPWPDFGDQRATKEAKMSVRDRRLRLAEVLGAAG